MSSAGGSSRQIVQYVLLRSDLLQPPLSWPLGAIIAQACHASTAAIAQFWSAPDCQEYVAEDVIDHMHKVSQWERES